MAKGFASCVLLIMYLSLLMLCSTGNGHSQHHNHQQDGGADPLDGARKVGFFTVDDLYVGKVVGIQFYTRDPSSLPPFLSKEVADRFPFSVKELPLILQLFGMAPGSPEAQLAERTLRFCADEPIKGEQKTCATSIESFIEFASSMLGGGQYGVDFRAIKTTHLGKPVSVYQNYTFLDIKEVHSPIMVACHIMDYPYIVYMCHSQTSRVYQIKIVGQEVGDALNAVAVCHIDTSQWAPDHVSFKLLGVKPGTVSICHFFGPHNPVWVKN
ncbi:BURP domain protein USPL1 [Ziziphus jujuba]|uniref:BURP domain protein USPL1 n=2 Tax=Ziziphus jujuba TaxID=326968 RepID=A0ABM3IXH8_ZIZJJ|nr:BURP domain protein USPL1 [Ziziphus jujuba]KAH7517849.1 hypothetical protein FEM48_Zijuj09G0107800 [Ziziphus jujuba var. spinosa]